MHSEVRDGKKYYVTDSLQLSQGLCYRKIIRPVSVAPKAWSRTCRWRLPGVYCGLKWESFLTERAALNGKRVVRWCWWKDWWHTVPDCLVGMLITEASDALWFWTARLGSYYSEALWFYNDQRRRLVNSWQLIFKRRNSSEIWIFHFVP